MKLFRSELEIDAIKEASLIAAKVLSEVKLAAVEGINTYDLDQIAKIKISEYGAKSACYNYRSGNNIFPCYSCISINDEIVHGIGKIDRVVNDGDLVSLDICVEYNGFIGDNATTITVGKVEKEIDKLLEVTHKALFEGIKNARSGNRVGDISNAIESYIKPYKFGIVREFVGHGVGRKMHEFPQIPNFGRKGTGDLLVPGMTLAIEPMVNLGTDKIKILNDGWTAVSLDGSPSVHFEHTVLITDGEPEILTKLKN